MDHFFQIVGGPGDPEEAMRGGSYSAPRRCYSVRIGRGGRRASRDSPTDWLVTGGVLVTRVSGGLAGEGSQDSDVLSGSRPGSFWKAPDGALTSARIRSRAGPFRTSSASSVTNALQIACLDKELILKYSH